MATLQQQEQQPSMASSTLFTHSSLLPPPSHLFTPIPENEMGEQDQEEEAAAPRHHATPLHTPTTTITTTTSSTARKKKGEQRLKHQDSGHAAVSCNKCRPSIVPVDPNYNILKSLISSLTLKSPHSSSSSSSTAAAATTSSSQNWKLTAAELSRKLISATKVRDDAVCEASKLKLSVSELEKKITRLESYCHSLKSALRQHGGGDCRGPGHIPLEPNFPIEAFLGSVSEARTMVRYLSRALAAQIRHSGSTQTMDRICLLLKPYEIRVPPTSKGINRSFLYYLEALLNRVLYEDFESAGFQRCGSRRILDPFKSCESNRNEHGALKGLSWEDVLSKGTRHFSEGLSGFCDRKMSSVVAMIGWERAWPEPLLQAFFAATKGVWLVHLLAGSVHPPVPLFRVDKGDRFEPGFMEDVVVDQVGMGSVGTVRLMLSPGFYVFNSVVKCKVICM